VELRGPDVDWLRVNPIGVPSVVHIDGADKLTLLASLRTQGVLLNRAAELLFDDSRFVPLAQPRSVEVIRFSVAALGLSNGATYRQLIARAFDLGFVECPLELAAHLRLQFLKQPEVPSAPSSGCAPAGSITVTSEPLDDSETTPKGFYLRRFDDALWLRGYWAPVSHHWAPEDELLFARAQIPSVPDHV